MKLELEVKKVKDSQLENVLKKWLSYARGHRPINFIYSLNKQTLSYTLKKKIVMDELSLNITNFTTNPVAIAKITLSENLSSAKKTTY